MDTKEKEKRIFDLYECLQKINDIADILNDFADSFKDVLLATEYGEAINEKFYGGND